MPTRKPADVWTAPPDTPDTTPATPAPAPAAPAPEPTPPPTLAGIDIPPGPIHLELRINNRSHFAQRVYAYTIDQTHPNHTTITAHLTPTDTPND